MFIEKWIFISLLIILVFMLVLCLRLGKQVRALRFCFLHFSDWTHQQMSDNREYLISKYGIENISTDITNFERIWLKELRHTDQVMKGAGLSKLSNDDKLYALENGDIF